VWLFDNIKKYIYVFQEMALFGIYGPETAVHLLRSIWVLGKASLKKTLGLNTEKVTRGW
jgi:hypothetical protein